MGDSYAHLITGGLIARRAKHHNNMGTALIQKDRTSRRNVAFPFTDGQHCGIQKATRTAAATVCQQNLHCRAPLVSITLSCLSSSPRSCRLRSECSDGLSHSKQQAKLE